MTSLRTLRSFKGKIDDRLEHLSRLVVIEKHAAAIEDQHDAIAENFNVNEPVHLRA